MVNNPYDTRGDGLGPLPVVFVGALLYNPAALALWFFYSYPLSPQCYAGPFCGFDRFPGVLQLALVLLSMVITLLVAWLVVRVGFALDLPRGFWASMSSRAAFRELRGVLVVCSGALLLLVIASLISGRATLPMVMLGLLTSALMLALVVASAPARDTSSRATARNTSPFANAAPTQPNQAGWRTAAGAAGLGAAADTTNDATNDATNDPANNATNNTVPPGF